MGEEGRRRGRLRVLRSGFMSIIILLLLGEYSSFHCQRYDLLMRNRWYYSYYWTYYYFTVAASVSTETTSTYTTITTTSIVTIYGELFLLHSPSVCSNLRPFPIISNPSSQSKPHSLILLSQIHQLISLIPQTPTVTPPTPPSPASPPHSPPQHPQQPHHSPLCLPEAPQHPQPQHQGQAQTQVPQSQVLLLEAWLDRQDGDQAGLWLRWWELG